MVRNDFYPAVTRGIISRSPIFDGMFLIQTVEEVFTQTQSAGFWLNVEVCAVPFID